MHHDSITNRPQSSNRYDRENVMSNRMRVAVSLLAGLRVTVSVGIAAGLAMSMSNSSPHAPFRMSNVIMSNSTA